jgi:hypothetical protein
LCIALERGNDESEMRGLQQWLSTNPDLRKPALPSHRGELTIGHVQGISDPDEYGQAVNAWARSAWEAWRELQPVAREWLSRSAASGRKHQKS